MTMFTIVTRGLLRRPMRTSLTLLGISIGIAAVVALVGIASGFQRSWEVGLKVRGTDIVVSNMNTSLTPKPFPLWYPLICSLYPSVYLPHMDETLGYLSFSVCLIFT